MSLAHVRPDSGDQEDALLLSHRAALHPFPDPDMTVADDILTRPQALVLARWAEIVDAQADQEDHPPMTLMTEGMTNALIIEKENTSTNVIAASALAHAHAVAKIVYRLHPCHQPEVQRHQGSENERDIVRLSDMRLQPKDGEILPQCLHPLKNGAKLLTDLRMWRAGINARQKVRVHLK